MTTSARTVVLGAGLSGLSAAFHLGDEAELYEREGEVGGLCRSRLLNGFTFDYVGHLLHFRHPEMLRLLRDTLRLDLVHHERSAWVYSKQTFTKYPFQANSYGLPIEVVKECLLGMAQHADDQAPPANFEKWIYRTFGEGVARHFMVPYNLKFWTVPPRDLTCAWLDGYVPVPTFEEALEGALTDSRRQLGYNAHFWYPRRGGIQAVAEAFAQRLNGSLHLGVAATRIDVARRRITLADGRDVPFERLLSSIPLPELGKLLDPLPAEVRRAFSRLRYTSVYVLNLGVARERISDRHWIYFPEPELSFFRVGFPMNFSATVVPPGHSSMYVEVSHSPQRPLEPATIQRRIRQDLVTAGILRADDRIVAQDPVNIKYAYVLFDADHAPATALIARFLEAHGITGIGRYGRWQYLSMEDSILDGQRAAATLRTDNAQPLLATHR